MNAPAPSTTKRDLVERGLEALDPQKAGATRVSQSAGGVTFATAMEVMEFSKLMAVSGTGVPEHLRGNAGTCMRIVFQAIEWRMSPYAVADKSYIVKDKLAYESQLIHAVIEARAPLQKRLDCKYAGEGPTRTCTVIGMFTDGEIREYTTPEFQKIPTKNSPLWTADPDQQLWYYASRAWARRWCPDVLMGIYSKEELRENPELGARDDEPSNGLRERLAAGGHDENEGASPGHVDRELANVVGDGTKAIIIDVKAEDITKTNAQPQPDKGAAGGKSGPKDGKRGKRASAAPKGDAGHAEEPAKSDPERAASLENPADRPSDASVGRIADRAESQPEKPEAPKLPKTAGEYAAYAKAWIAESKDVTEMNQRWKDEMTLRNNCHMTADNRDPIYDILVERREQLL